MKNASEKNESPKLSSTEENVGSLFANYNLAEVNKGINDLAGNTVILYYHVRNVLFGPPMPQQETFYEEENGIGNGLGF